MPLHVIRQDMTKIECDAIVNPTNTELFPTGGLDAAIHEAAGRELLVAAEALRPLKIGEAKVADAYLLPCRHVIFTAGPRWQGGAFHEEDELISCYQSCLALARSLSCESVALPLIAAGTLGFPKTRVMKIALSAISDFLFENEMTVYLVVYDKSEYEISRALFCDVQSYIGQTMANVSVSMCEELPQRRRLPPRGQARAEMRAEYNIAPPIESLDDMLKHLDRGFSDTLFFYIDKKGITDVECYKRSNVDKKTFSKIKCNPKYRPSKLTVISFAIGLHLTVDEAYHLLETAGMTLSKSSRFDVIILYFLTTGNYETIHDVNEVLYQFDEVTLGC